MGKFKKGDIVEVIPNDRCCREIQDQYGKKQVIENVVKKRGKWAYTLRGLVSRYDGPFIFPEETLQFYEQQLSFSWIDDKN